MWCPSAADLGGRAQPWQNPPDRHAGAHHGNPPEARLGEESKSGSSEGILHLVMPRKVSTVFNVSPSQVLYRKSELMRKQCEALNRGLNMLFLRVLLG